MSDSGVREPGKESLIKVASLQMDPEILNKERNIQETLKLIEQAGKEGVKLMVLPELCNSGYIFNTRGEAFSVAEEIPIGSTTQAWIEAAKQYNAYIVGGLPERVGARLYNSSVLVGPEGYIGTYRKAHLWNEEKLWFEPGNSGFPIFSLPFGRIAMQVCYDIWFPEVARISVAQGADLICHCGNWPEVEGLISKEDPTPAFSAQQLSLMNACFFVCANRVGTERGTTFIGSSCITDCASHFLAGPGSTEDPEVVMAEINIVSARYRHWSLLNNPLTDRRTDLFDEFLGYSTGFGTE